MTDLTPEVLADLRALNEQASNAPWTVHGVPYDGYDGPWIEAANGEYVAQTAYDSQSWSEKHPIDEDALLIVAMRNALPALLDIAEREAAARKRVEELRQLHIRAALCLSGFVGEGVSVVEFEDPEDVFHDLAKAIGMEDADDDDLRAALSPTEQEKG